MLQLKNYTISIGEKKILHWLNTIFDQGKTTVIVGHNGSGKSSLALSLMGHPRYTVSWKIEIEGDHISTSSPTDRQARWLFLSFQNIPEIPGIKVSEYLRTIYNSHFARQNIDTKSPSPFVFRRMVEKLLPPLHIDPKLLDRDLFVGFSGGEKRKIELLQISLLNPKVIILDEMDSGLDIDALSVLVEQIQEWQEKHKTIIIISHNFYLLDQIHIDRVMVMKDGNIEKEGTKELLEIVKQQGFN
jgi:Fe-S cluster assembly ATP-binding protein